MYEYIIAMNVRSSIITNHHQLVEETMNIVCDMNNTYKLEMIYWDKTRSENITKKKYKKEYVPESTEVNNVLLMIIMMKYERIWYILFFIFLFCYISFLLYFIIIIKT